MSAPLVNESLKIIRLYWGKTQSDLARELGTSQSYISEIEKGQKEVTLNLLEKYSQALGVPMSSLLLFAEKVQDAPSVGPGKLFVATKALDFLKKMLPNDLEKAG